MITTSTQTGLISRRVIAAAGIVVLTLAAATITDTAYAAGGPSPVTHGHGLASAARAAPDSPGPICAGNLGRPNGTGVAAQDFEPAWDAYDAWGAADFTLATTCKVKTVYIPGVAGIGPATGITISFHESHPSGPALCSTKQKGPGPSFTVNVGRCSLKPRTTYWLVAQVSQRFETSDAWFWATTDHRLGALDQWENPNDGYGTGCSTWGTVEHCIGNAGDYRFTIRS